MVRAADCRSAGPWLKSGCALGLLRFRPWHLAAASCTQGICAKVLKMPSTPGQSTAFSTCASLCFESVGRPPPVFSWCHTASSSVAHSASLGYIAQWSERLTADQQVPGSNLGVPSDCCAFAHGIWLLQAAHRESSRKSLQMPSTPGQSTAVSTWASLCFESVSFRGATLLGL